MEILANTRSRLIPFDKETGKFVETMPLAPMSTLIKFTRSDLNISPVPTSPEPIFKPKEIYKHICMKLTTDDYNRVVKLIKADEKKRENSRNKARNKQNREDIEIRGIRVFPIKYELIHI